MNAKPTLTISDAVYSAINQLDGGSEQEVIKRASKLCGQTVTASQFKRLLRLTAAEPEASPTQRQQRIEARPPRRLPTATALPISAGL